MRKIPWQSRKELHLQLAASCGVYHGLQPWFSMHFKSIATSLAKSANGKKSVRSTKGGICGVRTQRRSHHHHTGHPVAVWVPAWNVWLPQGPSYSMNVVVRIGKQRLYKPRDCHQILTSSRTVRQRLKTTTCGSVNRAKSVNGEVHGSGAPVNFLKESFRRRDMQRPIP